MPDLIDEILPSNRVHLLGGVPDVGKTGWVLPAMCQWARGEPIMGRASRPAPWVYVAGDRSEQEAREKIAKLELIPGDIRMIAAFGKSLLSTLDVLVAIGRMEPKPQLVVWEGFQDFAKGETKKDVREFLCSMTAHAENGNFTILGVVESPKMKPSEQYRNPRQRISGVSSWAYHSSTVIVIEGIKGDEALETDARDIWVCVKNGRRRKLVGRFDARGRLDVL